jgi:hypothetical protein
MPRIPAAPNLTMVHAALTRNTLAMEVWSDQKPLFWTALELPQIEVEEKEREEYVKDIVT